MKKARVLLSIARIWGFMSLLFLFFMLAGHIFGEDAIYFGNKKELFAFIFFPLGIVLGLFVAYRSSITGGLITLLSVMVSNLLIPALLANLYFLFSVFPGLLFFIHGVLNFKIKRS